jgi:DNA repair exonuclease SbcCD ATPase subunit
MDDKVKAWQAELSKLEEQMKKIQNDPSLDEKEKERLIRITQHKKALYLKYIEDYAKIIGQFADLDDRVKQDEEHLRQLEEKEKELEDQLNGSNGNNVSTTTTIDNLSLDFDSENLNGMDYNSLTEAAKAIKKTLEDVKNKVNEDGGLAGGQGGGGTQGDTLITDEHEIQMLDELTSSVFCSVLSWLLFSLLLSSVLPSPPLASFLCIVVLCLL